MPPEESERLFAHASFELLTIEATAHGVAGTRKAEVLFPQDRRRVQAKWKLAPPGTCDS